MSLYDRVRDGNGWFTHTWPLANSLNTLKITQDTSSTQYQFNLPSDVVLRHLLAFASANATRDYAPPYGF